MSLPVTVVIITRNRCPELLRTLACLAELPESPAVIVVDNASTDGTPAAVRSRFGSVEVIESARNLGAAGRNLGVYAAATPYVAFSDDDSWWAPGALTRAVAAFEAAPRLAVLAGRILVGEHERPDGICAAMSASPIGRQPDLPGPSVLGFLACGAVVRRTAYLSAGGFSARFGVGGEESLLAWDLAAAGWGLAYVDDVVAHHYPSAVRDIAARRRREVRNALWTAWLRRPPSSVRADLRRLLPRMLRDRAARGGMVDALRDVPEVLRERRRLPAWLEAQLRVLDAPA